MVNLTGSQVSQSQPHTQGGHSFSIDYQSAGDFFQVVFRGDTGLLQLRNSLRAILEHKQFHRNANACYDLRSAFPQVDMSEVEEHAHFLSRVRERRGDQYRLALVTSDTYVTALVRLIELIVGKTNIQVRVFDDTRPANQWLTE